ncbi:MAG: ion transporter [Eudoraea sp.]|nr:ion transporter [Eudoraea sp.]MBT8210517.1 ion transporter [Eudoraea sp.]MBT8223765.1 ion transporter [Eudoraea sp.]MBT8322585.1 ion transporter [Eudoraea sp.]NNK30015.1 ion transporter [Flavobacteriaceae bacterium]
MDDNNTTKKDWKFTLHEVIYGTHTPAGKFFDIVLLVVILYSVIIVMLESVPWFDEQYHGFLDISEWVVTILFTIEYVLRIICIKRPSKYIFSFFGVIDFLSTIPKYLSYLVVGSQYFAALRALRLLRVFRILKLVRFVGESNNLVRALKASRTKIFIFVFFVLIISVLLGTIMYLVEGPENGFNSIPHSVYWTIVTITTVGYGDISPQTALGQFIATFVMIIGYAIIAVPTGIVTVEFSKQKRHNTPEDGEVLCVTCGADGHEPTAHHCYHCGTPLP